MVLPLRRSPIMVLVMVKKKKKKASKDYSYAFLLVNSVSFLLSLLPKLLTTKTTIFIGMSLFLVYIILVAVLKGSKTTKLNRKWNINQGYP